MFRCVLLILVVKGKGFFFYLLLWVKWLVCIMLCVMVSIRVMVMLVIFLVSMLGVWVIWMLCLWVVGIFILL